MSINYKQLNNINGSSVVTLDGITSIVNIRDLVAESLSTTSILSSLIQGGTAQLSSLYVSNIKAEDIIANTLEANHLTIRDEIDIHIGNVDVDNLNSKTIHNSGEIETYDLFVHNRVRVGDLLLVPPDIATFTAYVTSFDVTSVGNISLVGDAVTSTSTTFWKMTAPEISFTGNFLVNKVLKLPTLNPLIYLYSGTSIDIISPLINIGNVTNTNFINLVPSGEGAFQAVEIGTDNFEVDAENLISMTAATVNIEGTPGAPSVIHIDANVEGNILITTSNNEFLPPAGEGDIACIANGNLSLIGKRNIQIDCAINEAKDGNIFIGGTNNKFFDLSCNTDGTISANSTLSLFTVNGTNRIEIGAIDNEVRTDTINVSGNKLISMIVPQDNRGIISIANVKFNNLPDEGDILIQAYNQLGLIANRYLLINTDPVDPFDEIKDGQIILNSQTDTLILANGVIQMISVEGMNISTQEEPPKPDVGDINILGETIVRVTAGDEFRFNATNKGSIVAKGLTLETGGAANSFVVITTNADAPAATGKDIILESFDDLIFKSTSGSIMVDANRGIGINTVGLNVDPVDAGDIDIHARNSLFLTANDNVVVSGEISVDIECEGRITIKATEGAIAASSLELRVGTPRPILGNGVLEAVPLTGIVIGTLGFRIPNVVTIVDGILKQTNFDVTIIVE